MLTARDATEDKIAGLGAGADDYIVKPFVVAELLARMRSLASRPQHFANSTIGERELQVVEGGSKHFFTRLRH